MPAPFKYYRTPDHIHLVRDASLIFRMELKNRTVETFKGAEQDFVELNSKTVEKDISCFGIFGQLELVNGTFLILIDSAEHVGKIINAPIYRVTKLKFVLLSQLIKAKITSEDQRYIDMFVKITNEKAFYFSFMMDLTTSI